jgi:hypothetical protein
MLSAHDLWNARDLDQSGSEGSSKFRSDIRDITYDARKAAGVEFVVSRKNAAAALIIYELAGLPGAGKTTLIDMLGDKAGARAIIGREDLRGELYGRGWSARLKYLFHLAVAPVRNVGLVVHLVRYAARASRLSLGVITQILRCNQLAYHLDLLKRRPGGGGRVILLDQGFLQYVASMSIPGSGPLPDATTLVRKLSDGRLSGLVWLSCSSEVATQRLQSRQDGESRFERGGSIFGSTQYQRFAEAITSAVATIDSEKVDVLVVDAGSEPSHNARRLNRWLSGSPTNHHDSAAVSRRQFGVA